MKNRFLNVLMFFGIVGISTSCHFMHDDLPECATDPDVFTRVHFVYDYNVDDNDYFTDHIGSVYLYVFDQEGFFLRRIEQNREYTSDPNFAIMMDSTELRPGHEYQFLALANGNHHGYEASLSTPGFQKENDLIPGVSTINDYKLVLDTDGDGDVDIFSFSQQFNDQNIEQLDTVWTTLTPQFVEVPRIKAPFESPVHIPDTVVDVTIPLMRITNHINLRIRSNSFNADTNPDDFHITMNFPHGNGQISFTGETLGDKNLYYRTIRKRMENSTNLATSTKESKLLAEFNVSRLQTDDESNIQIFNSEGTKLLAQVDNLSGLLAQGNEAYVLQGWDDQEYLDREYEYDLELQIDDLASTEDTIKFKWIEVQVKVLGWAVRIQYGKL